MRAANVDGEEEVKASDECTATTEAKMAIIEATVILMLFVGYVGCWGG